MNVSWTLDFIFQKVWFYHARVFFLYGGRGGGGGFVTDGFVGNEHIAILCCIQVVVFQRSEVLWKPAARSGGWNWALEVFGWSSESIVLWIGAPPTALTLKSSRSGHEWSHDTGHHTSQPRAAKLNVSCKFTATLPKPSQLFGIEVFSQAWHFCFCCTRQTRWRSRKCHPRGTGRGRNIAVAANRADSSTARWLPPSKMNIKHQTKLHMRERSQ